MEIKLKCCEVLRINTVLKSIIEDDKVNIESPVSNFELIKNEKIVEYGEETEDGVFQIKQDNPKALEPFEKDIRQVLDSEVLINIHMLKPDEVFDKGLTTEYLMGLYPIIEN